MQACPYCAGDLADESAACPHCGQRLAAAPAEPARPTLLGALGCGLVGVLVALLSLTLFFGLVAGGLLGP
ncbi:MAG TPA: hypothetical protein VII13_01065 [Vicinamibacteria bacterium]|jgi:hypothetical protein